MNFWGSVDHRCGMHKHHRLNPRHALYIGPRYLERRALNII